MDRANRTANGLRTIVRPGRFAAAPTLPPKRSVAGSMEAVVIGEMLAAIVATTPVSRVGGSTRWAEPA